jgi:ribosome maturation factor RimP
VGKDNEQLYALTRSTVAGMGYCLLAVEDGVEGGRRIVRFVVDHPRGVTLGDCRVLSRELGYLLEGESGFEERYSLEVSSPGLDRELGAEREYAHFSGREARFVLREPVGGQSVLFAVIVGVESGGVRVRQREGDEFIVPFRAISRARLAG